MDSGFATATATDTRAWLWVASFLSLIYSVLCLAARLTGKWDLLWWDDMILGAGYLASIVHWGLLFQAITDGLGVATIAISASDLSAAARVCESMSIPVLGSGGTAVLRNVEAQTQNRVVCGTDTACRCILAPELLSL